MTIGSGRDDGSLMAVFACMLLCRVAEVWMVNERRCIDVRVVIVGGGGVLQLTYC